MKIRFSSSRYMFTSLKKSTTLLLLALLSVSFVPFSALAATVYGTVTHYPVAVGSHDAWDVNVGDKVQAVNNNDGDDTYITATKLGKAQTFVFTTPALPSGATIDTVSIYMFAKKTDVSDDGITLEENNPRIAFRAEDGALIHDGDENIIANDGMYVLYGRHMGVNPFTGAAWTFAELASGATRFGIIRTNEGSETGIEPRVTKVWMDVDYVINDATSTESGTGGSGGSGGSGSGSGSFSSSTLTFTVDEEAVLTFTASSTTGTGTTTFALAPVATGTVPTGASIDPVTGVFTWTPTEAQGPAVYTFVIVATNGSNTTTTTVTVTVNEVNAVPIANAKTLTTPVDTVATTTLTGTDSDIPAQTLIYAIATTTANGTTTLVGDIAVYTPNVGFTGTDSFTFTVFDGIATSSPATVTITIGSAAAGAGGSGGGSGGGSSGGGSGGSGGSSSGGSGGGSSISSGGGYFVNANGQPLGGGSGGNGGQVLGASSTCGLYITKYTRNGYDNDQDTVKKIQVFLNSYLGSSIPVTGYYGSMTEQSIRELQVRHTDVMLKPWGINTPSGIAYLTTVTGINNIVCPELRLPIPTNLVVWSQNAETPDKVR